MKKGILMSLGMTFLIFSLYYLTLTIAHYHQDESNLFNEIAPLQRLGELDTSLQLAVKRTFMDSLSLDLNIINGALIITQPLPLNSSNLATNLDALKSFVEGNFSGVNVTVSDLKKSSQVMIMPANFSYEQDYSANTTIINVTDLNATSYDIAFQFYSNITSCSNSVTAGTFNLTVRAYGFSNTSCIVSKLVNIQGTNSVDINNLRIDSTSLGGLIIRGRNEQADLTLKIPLPSAQGKMLKAEIPDVVSINISKFKVSRSGAVLLAAE